MEDDIYTPSSAGQDAEWVSSEDRVWTAPEWLESKRRLNGVSKFADHEQVFHVILKIGDTNWRDYLKDLEMMKEKDPNNTERAVNIYRRLWREFELDSSWEPTQ
jgi:hypothetical protein